jgi:hypothetical protein
MVQVDMDPNQSARLHTKTAGKWMSVPYTCRIDFDKLKPHGYLKLYFTLWWLSTTGPQKNPKRFDQSHYLP